MGNFENDYVPMALWSKDHWSTLGYVESVIVDCAGFQVGADPRMRSNRRHFRVMHEECPRPKRFGKTAMGVVMNAEHGTRLKDGSTVPNHDDWMCIQDMAAEGFFTVGPDEIEPGVTISLSKKGMAFAESLRRHKSNGGVFANFDSGSVTV